MRAAIVWIALASTLCACEQTDPATARGAGGAVGGAALEQSTQVDGSVTQAAEPTSKTAVPKGRVITKTELHHREQTENAGESQRDAASGLPTGKRQHKPVVLQ